MIVCSANMWYTRDFVYLDNDMMIICILPLRVSEGTTLVWLKYRKTTSFENILISK